MLYDLPKPKKGVIANDHNQQGSYCRCDRTFGCYCNLWTKEKGVRPNWGCYSEKTDEEGVIAISPFYILLYIIHRESLGMGYLLLLQGKRVSFNRYALCTLIETQNEQNWTDIGLILEKFLQIEWRWCSTHDHC